MSSENVLEILDLFGEGNKGLTVPDIAQLLKRPQSSVYRYVKLLKNHGYIMEFNQGYYKLGYKLLSFSNAIKADSNILTFVLPMMEKLRTETGETIILLVPSGLSAVCLAVYAPHSALKVVAEQGKIVPLHAGASAKALLAHMPEKVVDELFKKDMVKKYTDTTFYERDTLKSELKKIKQLGYASSYQEIDKGVMGYGVPIFNSDNVLVASLSLCGPITRIVNKPKEPFVEHLQRAARELKKYI